MPRAPGLGMVFTGAPGRAGPRTILKPNTLLSRKYPSMKKLREADRQSSGGLFQAPPRITWYIPEAGPVGSTVGPLGYVPYQSWHHSQTLPCAS